MTNLLALDNLDGKLLRVVADYIATPICHIFNLSLEESLCPQAWREAKVIPLPKSGKAACHALVEVFCVYLHVLGQARVWHGIFVLWCVLSWGFGVYVLGL